MQFVTYKWHILVIKIKTKKKKIGCTEIINENLRAFLNAREPPLFPVFKASCV